MKGRKSASGRERTVTDMKPNDEVTITYTICAATMLKLWIDDVLTDDEYNRIMDKLNAWNRREGGQDGDVDARSTSERI